MSDVQADEWLYVSENDFYAGFLSYPGIFCIKEKQWQKYYKRDKRVNYKLMSYFYYLISLKKF